MSESVSKLEGKPHRSCFVLQEPTSEPRFPLHMKEEMGGQYLDRLLCTGGCFQHVSYVLW